MPGRIVVNGQTAWATRRWGENRPVAPAVPRNRAGEAISLDPIPPTSPDSPFREGTAYHCPDDDLTYRVLSHINVSEGWGTSSFWCKRWRCTFKQLLDIGRRGWLDAAIDGALTKRYRCRDEHRCLDWLATQRSKTWQRQQQRKR